MFFFWDDAAELSVRTAVAGIDAIITDHFEVLFRDMLDKPLHEIQNGNGLVNKLVIFVSVVVECHEFTIIFINARNGDHGSSEISANVSGNGGRIAEDWFGINIETILLITVNGSFYFFEGVADFFVQFIQKSSQEGLAKKLIVEVLKRTPESGITDAAFRNEAVNVGIPFQIPSEGVEDTDETGSKTFRFIDHMEHS